MKLAVIQMNSGPDVPKNLEVAWVLMEQAVASDGADWLLLPEHFQCAGGSAAQRKASAEVLGEGPAYAMCQRFAREKGVYVHAGSLYEALPGDRRIANTTVVFNRSGEQIALYRKIHLFDITGPGGIEYRESDTVARGDAIVIYEAEGVRFGCAICYDLRFPELFRALSEKGADVIALPAAFLLHTGKDHWEPLLRARAIENQVYVAASGSWGAVERDGRLHHTWGRSMIVDPWGQKIAQVSDSDGVAAHRFDRDLIAKIRRDIPIARHRVIGVEAEAVR